MPAYYNEIDPYAAQWLRELIKGGHIAPGDVDERDIRDVSAADLAGYEQCHFFAGIGGWSRALRLANWDDARSVWTGSCPCQPFSSAGARKSVADERHLWPHWFRLIRERKPPTIFGEQVARAIGDQWLDAAAHDLEAEGYATGAATLPACAVGAPHIRDRLWFVANATGAVGERNRTKPHAKQAGSANGGRWKAEPKVGRVVDGFPGRVDQLRALGNAIVPQVAAEFIAAFAEIEPQ